jgi:hypothetical protein
MLQLSNRNSQSWAIKTAVAARQWLGDEATTWGAERAADPLHGARI